MRAGRRAGRVAALVAVFSLWLGAWAPAAGAATLSEHWPPPSLAGLRSWLAGTGPSAGLPRQADGRISQAAMLGRQVPASVTRAGRGAGRPPGRGRGQLPRYEPHAVSRRRDTTPPDRTASGFSLKSSKLVTSATTATTDLYKNANGSYTRLIYTGPVNYRDAAGGYRPIQTALTAAGSGWRERANSLSVRFARRPGRAALMSAGLGDGQGFRLGLAGGLPVTGTVSGSTVTYPGVLPDTDLAQTALDTGADTTLTLTSPAAPSSWLFPLRLRGLTVVPRGGGVSLAGPGGSVAWTIGQGLASAAMRGRHGGGEPATVAATWRVTSDGGTPALRLSVPAGWLHNPARVFPVTVEIPGLVPDENTHGAVSQASPQGSGQLPRSSSSGDEGTTGTTYVETGSENVDHSQDNLMKIGTYNGGGVVARTFFQFGNLGDVGADHLQDYQILSATLHVFVAWAAACSQGEPWDTYPVTQSWTLTSMSWAGPSTGSTLGESDSQAPSAACGNTALDPSVGGYISDHLSTGLFNNWTLGTSTNDGLALRAASETDDNQWKKLDGFNSPNPPYLELSYTPDVPPQINTLYPQNDYNASSLTPQLMATGVDPDTWPDPLTYQFAVYDSSGNLVACSTPASDNGCHQTKTTGSNPIGTGWISAAAWRVPSSTLQWGKVYAWVVQDYDGLDTGTSATYFLTTQIPQPAITSAVQNTGAQGITPGSGDYTTSATDAQVSAVGPVPAIQRYYDSGNSASAGAFGSGWSSILDMRVTGGASLNDDASIDTATVDYPDGEQVTFGQNANGTYSAPQGRYATLASVTGGYTLTDKNDTVYTFKQGLGNGGYGITSVTDALGNTEQFTWSASGPPEITSMTSVASGRSLAIVWSTPAGAGSPHVSTVTTNDVVPNVNSSALTWSYAYSGDNLTGVCSPASSASCAGATACPAGSAGCTAYTYTQGSGYFGAVLATGPHSYWPLDDSSGHSAASIEATNEGTDDGTYSGVTLGQAGPAAGSAATSASFNGTSSSVQMPSSLVPADNYQTISVWFKTTTRGGVIFGSSGSGLGSEDTTVYTPNLYVGETGDLHAQFLTGSPDPISTPGAVTDGRWHQAVLTSSGDSQTLYLDGTVIGSRSGPVNNAGLAYDSVGAGMLGGSWPDQPSLGLAVSYFTGSIADVGIWDRPLSATEVTELYQRGTTAESELSSITRPSGSVYATVSYSSLNGSVTSVTDDNGLTWSLAAPTVTGSSQVYVSAVLGQGPADYWRLADTDTTQAINQVNGGTASFGDVTQGVSGPFSDSAATSFNGISSYLKLPDDLLDGGASQSVSLWFKTESGGQALLGYSQDPVTNGSTSNGYVPALYLGTGGDLHGEFWDGQSSPIMSGSPVDDDQWHNVVLTTSPQSNQSDETMYLDGKLVGTISGNGAEAAAYSYGYVGAGFLASPWPDAPSGLFGRPGNDPIQTPAAPSSYFDGSIADVAVYKSQLTAAQVTEEYAARSYSGGLTPVETVQTVQQASPQQTVSYQLDPLNGDRVIAQTDALGNTTKYGYDTSGFEYSVTDPDGDMTTTGHDIRGNITSQTTCQDQALDECSTAYYSYYPDDTDSAPSPDPRNDLPLTARGPGSASATDDTYLTSYAYNSSGELTSQTGPAVTGFPDGRTTTYTYTTSSTPAYNSSGQVSGTAPAGLPLTETSPGGAVTSLKYYSDGDVYAATDPDGLVTTYTYDGLGRVLTKTVISDSYPAGLTTTYAYDAMGDVVTETDPPVTDSVTSATHTARITTSYDADGDVTGQTVADLTGGDASRTVTRTYDSHDHLATSTDAAGAKTSYSYDLYGNLFKETDPAGNVTQYTYDPDGDLLTTTLENYAGGLADAPSAGTLVESARTYDPAGRLATITDARGFITAYTYTDDGLLATETRCGATGCTGSSYVEQSNAYNAAGQLVSQATSNGRTTTDYTPDAAGRATSATVDPGALDRTTSYTYTPDDAVASQTLTDSSGSAVRSASYTYDAMGNMTSQSRDLKGGGDPDGWWLLTQQNGTSVPDASGTGHTATSSAVSWTGNSGTFNGSTSQIATAGPVLDTTGSFTVSAWVNPATAVAWEAAVSQDASQNSAFQLQYDATTGGWAFGRKNADTNNGPVSIRAVSTGDAVLGSWQYLTATYDGSTGLMILYVNGTAQGTATDTAPYPSTGPLVIGRGQYEGSPTDYFDGSISDVQVYQRALSASQISALYGLGRNGGADPSNLLTTTWKLDERGLPTSMTDPDQATTTYRYDQAGQLAVTTYPVVTSNVYGQAPAQVAPVTSTGYDTFGDPVESEDADGNVTTTAYDADGRAVSATLPSYTPPDGSGTIAAARAATVYNSLGEVTSQTDPDGNITGYDYDQLGDLTSETAPDNGVTSYAYNADGEQVSQTSPTGAVTTAAYDFLGRQTQVIQQERYPSATSYSTTYTYGDGTAPWLSAEQTPDGVTTSYTYDNAGEVTGVTDGAGNATAYAYDAAGDPVKVTYPRGEYSTAAYDEAGRQTGEADYSEGGTQLRGQSAAYDDDGNLLSATDYRGYTTSFLYDALGQLSSETQPVSATSAITTSFGYDPAGNPTRYTDGNGSDWWATYNPWNLQESTIEPPTAAAPTAVDGTFTTSYDSDGNPVSVSEPGGVTVTSGYNNMNELTAQSGTGADAPTVSRSFGYDLDGNLTSASAPGGTDTFAYDDRGLLTSATGPSGSSSFTYNGDGLMTSATDPAGTTGYTYDDDDRLLSLSDPATGDTLGYSYNTDSELTQISYGSGKDTQAFGYNDLHELTSDTLDTASGQQVASITYGYDPDGDLTSKDTSGFGTATDNTYTYDEADRLASWNNGSATVGYSYDADGNRTQVGGTTYTYDARDELTSDGTSSYAYTMRGTLSSVTGPGGTASFTSDAFGQAVTQDGQAYAYDALGRVVSDTGSGGSASFTYIGASTALASDGSSTYTWDPGGTSLVGIGVAGGPQSAGVLALTDAHADVVGNFAAGGASLSGSSVYDPLGNVLSSTGMLGRLGFQSGWTDPATGRVDMSARWYDPAAGVFTSRDTAGPSPAPDSAAANPFAYAGGNPVSASDPTGHFMAMTKGGGAGDSDRSALARSYEAEAEPSGSCSGFFGCLDADVSAIYGDAQRVYHTAVKVIAAASADIAGYTRQAEEYLHEALRAGVAVAGRVGRDLETGVDDAAALGVHALGTAWHATVSASSGMVHTVTRWAAAGVRAQIQAVRTAIHNVAATATAAAAFLKSHAAQIGVMIASVAVFAGCEAVLGAATGGVGAVAGAMACGALAGEVSGALSYGVQAVQSHSFSWQGLAESVAVGGLEGAAGGALGGLAGLAGDAVSGLLADGAASDAATVADSAAADGAADSRAAASADPADVPAARPAGGSSGAGPADTAATGGGDTAASGGTESTGTASSQGQATPDTPSSTEASSGGERATATCGGMSFTAGTKVLTAKGTLVAISKLKVGDKVEATSTKTGKTTAQPVTAVLVHYDTNRYNLKIRAGHRTATIDTTSNHLFWDTRSNWWVRAGSLINGALLRTPAGGRSAKVLSGRTPDRRDDWMWDLTIGGDHDFYVQAATTAVLVHNCSTTEDLNAFGKKTAPRLPRMSDLGVSSEDDGVGPYSPQRPSDDILGASTFTDPQRAPLTGQYHLLPAGTELPEGLGIHADGEDVGGNAPWGHRTIYPAVSMTFSQFQKLFAALPWQWAGKI